MAAPTARRRARPTSGRRFDASRRRGAVRVWGLALLLVAGAGPAAAAQISLALSGLPLTFPAAGAGPADFSAGVLAATGGVTYTVDVLSGAANTQRTTIVSIRSTSANLGNGKPLADLEWRRSDLTAWNGLTNSDVTIESRPVQRNKLNDPWSNTVLFRVLLNWAADAPGAYSADLVFTLTVTTP